MASAWSDNAPTGDWSGVLNRGLVHVGAYAGSELVGFVHVAWDGRSHAFLLDPTVSPAWRNRGLGRQIVVRAAQDSRLRGAAWLHVDYVPDLTGFYAKCGFRPTYAGLMDLTSP